MDRWKFVNEKWIPRPVSHGEGFVRRYCFSTYACICSDNVRKAASSYRSLPHAGKAVIQKSRFPHPTSAPSGHLLPEEGGSIHASPFPWKGLPSAARQGWLPFSAAKPPPSFLIPISHSCRAFARDQGTACPTPTTKGQTNETYCYSPYDGGKNIDAPHRSFGSEAR